MLQRFLVTCLWFVLALAFVSPILAEGKIKVGVPTALTGEAAAFGQDIKNSLSLMNELYGGGKYELIFEDERCENRTAVSIANKLINLDKVRYALGFPCNGTLLATASIYERAGVLVITSSATSGDILDLGKHIFRLFPSDVAGAKLLLEYVAKRHSKVALLTEQNEYPVMMERSFRRENEKLSKPMEIVSEEFIHGESDLRTVLLKLINKGVEGIFVNANTDGSFIPLVKQLRALNFRGALYSVYLPGSAVAIKELGGMLNGFIYSNLPVADQLVTPKGREVLSEFRKRYGEPQSGFPVVPISFEAFRIFDLAVSSGQDPVAFLNGREFTGGFVPNYHFDKHGAVQGLGFQMQKIEAGKVVVIDP